MSCLSCCLSTFLDVLGIRCFVFVRRARTARLLRKLRAAGWRRRRHAWGYIWTQSD